MPESQTTPSLPTFSWLGHLAEDDRELLSSYGEFFPGHPGNVIIEEGASQTEVFVIISGELEVHGTQEDGTPSLLARLGPGQTLGEISLFHPGPATATVRASEFSQLWRIADSDLIQFMEENPGAGNVLLRTLATIFAQRLRQVDPEAFGLSAYAVVESPELEEQDAALASETANLTLSPDTDADTDIAASPVVPLPVPETPVAPVAAPPAAATPVTASPVTASPVIPLPVPPASAPAPTPPVTSEITLLRPTLHVAAVPLSDEPPLKIDTMAAVPSAEQTATGAPGPETVTAQPEGSPTAGRRLGKTQAITNPDELEPL